MRQLCELVGVTYGEFQSWYNYGELRLSADRLVHIEQDGDGVPDPDSPHTAILMERLPQLSLEDEEGVLIVQLAPSKGEDQSTQFAANLDPRTIHVPVARVQCVIPLTERAGRILEPRLGPLGVGLETAHFHKQVRMALS